MKFVRPKMKWVYDREIRKSKFLRQNALYLSLRTYPGTIRGTDE